MEERLIVERERERMEERLMEKTEDGRETDGKERDGRETESGGDGMVWATCKVTEGNSYVLMGPRKVQYISLKWTPVTFPSAPLRLAVCVIDSLGLTHMVPFTFSLCFPSSSSCLGFRVCRLFLFVCLEFGVVLSFALVFDFLGRCHGVGRRPRRVCVVCVCVRACVRA